MSDGQIKGPTRVTDLMDEDFLQAEIDEGFIRCKQHPTEDLWILNYSEKCMFEKRWNAATLKCRGLVLGPEGVIVARPWEKFFNLGEKATLIGSHDPVEITDKMDGSLGIGYPTSQGWRIATRGSFVSDQAVWASEWLVENTNNGKLRWQPHLRITPLFEIIYPDNRIVLDYGRFEGLVLLGAVDTQYGHVYGPYEAAGLLDWQSVTTKVFPEKTMAEFMSGPNAHRSNSEGVVVRSGWRMVKVKQDDYVQAHAVVTGLSNKAVWEMLASGNPLPEQASFMPDEFYAWIIKTAAELTEAQERHKKYALALFDAIGAQLQQQNGGAHTRKDFADIVNKLESSQRPFMFKLYDGQSIEELAWRAVKPVRFERPFNRSEDVT